MKPRQEVTIYPAAAEKSAVTCLVKYVFMRMISELNFLKIYPTALELKLLFHIMKSKPRWFFLDNMGYESFAKASTKTQRVIICSSMCDDILKLLKYREMVWPLVLQSKNKYPKRGRPAIRYAIPGHINMAECSIPIIDKEIGIYCSLYKTFVIPPEYKDRIPFNYYKTALYQKKLADFIIKFVVNSYEPSSRDLERICGEEEAI